jgi:hypothetical protein
MISRYTKIARILAKDNKNYVVCWDVVSRQEIILTDKEYMTVQMSKCDKWQEKTILHRWSKRVTE